VLGAPGSEAQAAERSETLAVLGEVWAGVVARRLGEHARDLDAVSAEARSALTSTPSWMRQHLRELGAAGAFTSGIATRELVDLYGQIAAYREHWNQHEDADVEQRGLTSLLGPRPDAPIARRQWNILAHRATAIETRRPRSRSVER
jgi:hypothetical protein